MRRLVICVKIGILNTIIYDDVKVEFDTTTLTVIRKDKEIGKFNIEDISWWTIGENIAVLEGSLHCAKEQCLKRGCKNAKK